MPKFTPVAPVTTIKKGTAKPFTIDGQDILIANIDGEFFAIEDRCSHEDSRLSLGCLKGELIDCTLHGSRFNVKTGLPTEEPAVDAVRTFKLKINHDVIEIETIGL